MGMSSVEWSRYMRESLGVPMSDDAISTSVVKRLEQLYRVRLLLIPGAREAVRSLASRLPLAIASSANRALIELALELAGLADCFEAAVSSEEVAHGKPAPDVYLEAARRIECEASSCAAVEDSANGIRAAAAAGMSVIAIPNRAFPPGNDVLAKADLVLPSIDVLEPSMLATLPGWFSSAYTAAAAVNSSSERGEEVMDGRHGRGSDRQVSRRELVRVRCAGRVVCVVVLAVALLGSTLAHTAAAGGLGFSWTPSKSEPYSVCGRPTPRHAACLAILVPSTTGLSSSSALLQAAPGELSPTVTPTLQGTGVGGGFAPADLRSAYDLPSEADGSGQTVAIVDAYDDPEAERDLERYRSHYGIAACTTANGCFEKVNQRGETTSLPKAEASWAVEISLDLDMVSAACPKCHILLVEAINNSDENLYTAEDQAAKLGASEISNSWAGEEYSGETSDDIYFDHPGVPIFASAGDDDYGVYYPAASQYVVAVGGTALKKTSSSRGWSETVWKGTGSGCSQYELKPAWQTASPDCEKRTNNDIAAVASPETPVSIADSYKLPREFSQPEAGWMLVGGTSVSSPLMAGTMALADAYTKSFGGADAYYKEAVQNGTGVLNNVTSGSNGSCGDYLCNGEVGYNGPTGLGSPYGAPIVTEGPTIVTKAASLLTQTTATLNGTVNPAAEEVTKCEFEYGTTTSFGSSVPCSSLPGSGESPGSGVGVGVGSDPVDGLLLPRGRDQRGRHRQRQYRNVHDAREPAGIRQMRRGGRRRWQVFELWLHAPGR